MNHTNILLDEQHKLLYISVVHVKCRSVSVPDIKHITLISTLTLCEDKGLLPLLRIRFQESGREDLFTPEIRIDDDTKKGWIEEFNLMFDNFIKDLKTQFGKDKIKIVKKTTLTFKEDENELKIVEKLKESKIFNVLELKPNKQKVYTA